MGNHRLAVELCNDQAINARTGRTGKTALMIASERGYKEICSFLLKQLAIQKDACDAQVGTVLDWVCEFEQGAISRMFLEDRDFQKISVLNRVFLLHRASTLENHGLLDLFLDTWKFPPTVDVDGNTPLLIAFCEGFLDVVTILLSYADAHFLGLGYTSIEEALGTRIRNNAGKTALGEAIAVGYLGIIELLRSHEIND